MSDTTKQLYLRHSISGTIRLVRHRSPEIPSALVIINVDKKTITKIVEAAECVLFVSGNLEPNYSAYSMMNKSPVFSHSWDGLDGPMGMSDWKAGDEVDVETDVTVAYELLNGSALIKRFWEGRPRHEESKESV
ncbi:hypothetical protein CBS147333_9915 [Penicillium roqueforti]|nr:hypothetical protein CBS147333_9915 [Penicillium roqueforti]KAI3190929.1 hypothetical protein CBS147311_9671 [Penicillium roqueforti]KAI3264246.1 hypothetical protein CBS147308_8080 [Penicillium roqueforti]KAI3283643.1 hypothetical protein DTO003C3_8404 [Penicillium roqueforti]